MSIIVVGNIFQIILTYKVLEQSKEKTVDSSLLMQNGERRIDWFLFNNLLPDPATRGIQRYWSNMCCLNE